MIWWILGTAVGVIYILGVLMTAHSLGTMDGNSMREGKPELMFIEKLGFYIYGWPFMVLGALPLHIYNRAYAKAKDGK